MFSSRLLIIPQRSIMLRRNLVAKLNDKGKLNISSRPKIGSIPVNRIEYGGHSDGVTPDPFPNSVDKPVRVLHCTQMRELSGTVDRCHIHLILSFLLIRNMINY